MGRLTACRGSSHEALVTMSDNAHGKEKAIAPWRDLPRGWRHRSFPSAALPAIILAMRKHPQERVSTLDPPAPTHCPNSTDLDLQPYRTAWDAIGDLDQPDWPAELQPTGKYAKMLPAIPEGQNYLWLTSEGIERWSRNGRGRQDGYWDWRTRYWSFLLKLAKDAPSWTISARPGFAESSNSSLGTETIAQSPSA